MKGQGIPAKNPPFGFLTKPPAKTKNTASAPDKRLSPAARFGKVRAKLRKETYVKLTFSSGFYSIAALLMMSALATSCGSPTGGGKNNGGDNVAATPENPSGKSTSGQTLVPIGTLTITPTLKNAGPVSDIEWLLESTSISVEGFREVILYGYATNPQTAIPYCELSDGNLLVANPNLAADVHFGMESGTLLKGSYASNVSELSRHLVSGKVMTVYLRSANPGSVNAPDEIPATIVQSTCKGSFELKVVGVLY